MWTAIVADHCAAIRSLIGFPAIDRLISRVPTTFSVDAPIAALARYRLLVPLAPADHILCGVVVQSWLHGPQSRQRQRLDADQA